jgi:alpha-tubulin suppressor-like RCC1 family protein
VQVGSATWNGVSAGAFHTCGVRVGGTLWCWGDNTIGQLGIGTQTPTMPVPTPTQVGTATDWNTVSAGWSHTNALRLPAN